MPASFNGIGTAYYGECDFRADGSYVTTEWVSLFYLPLVPLRSVRLIRQRKKDVDSVAFGSKSVILVERLPLHWRQVAKIYGFIGLCVAYVAALVHFPPMLGWSWDSIPPKLAAFIWLPLLSLPYVLPLSLRRRERQKAGFSPEALMKTITWLKVKQQFGA
ncbi:MAG: hypothetical protein J0L73_16155 [Verrucomicrobia bacterium]|nr:hypothetical protein [Verrucomicrobiota bacterium]